MESFFSLIYSGEVVHGSNQDCRNFKGGVETNPHPFYKKKPTPPYFQRKYQFVKVNVQNKAFQNKHEIYISAV